MLIERCHDWHASNMLKTSTVNSFVSTSLLLLNFAYAGAFIRHDLSYGGTTHSCTCVYNIRQSPPCLFLHLLPRKSVAVAPLLKRHLSPLIFFQVYISLLHWMATSRQRDARPKRTPPGSPRCNGERRGNRRWRRLTSTKARVTPPPRIPAPSQCPSFPAQKNRASQCTCRSTTCMRMRVHICAAGGREDRGTDERMRKKGKRISSGGVGDFNASQLPESGRSGGTERKSHFVAT